MAAKGRMDSLRSPFGRLWRLSPLRGSDELPTRGFSTGYRGVRCSTCIAKHDDPQLLHANLTQISRTIEHQ